MKRSFVPFFLVWTIVLAQTAVGADDAWFIDTRHATLRSQGETLEHLRVDRLEETSRPIRWTPSGMDAFLETHDPETPLVVLIHGNWMTYPRARNFGMTFRRLSRKLGEHRMLFWTWPSERLNNLGLRQDALVKARRADVQARFLAAFLRKLPPESKVSLVGFSFGARLSCETLQLIADTDQHDLQLRTVLLAGAMDRQSLMPGRDYGNAMTVTEKMLVHINPEDYALRWYPHLKGCGGPQAVGKEGVSIRGLPQDYREKIRTRNVRRLIGRDHGFMPSMLALFAMREDFRHYCLFED